MPRSSATVHLTKSWVDRRNSLALGLQRGVNSISLQCIPWPVACSESEWTACFTDFRFSGSGIRTMIRIRLKSWSVRPCPDTCRCAKFHPNPCTCFWVILLTDRQTYIAGNCIYLLLCSSSSCRTNEQMCYKLRNAVFMTDYCWVLYQKMFQVARRELTYAVSKYSQQKLSQILTKCKIRETIPFYSKSKMQMFTFVKLVNLLQDSAMSVNCMATVIYMLHNCINICNISQFLGIIFLTKQLINSTNVVFHEL